MATTTTTRWLYPGYVASLAATADVYRLRVTRSGTLQHLYVMQNTPSTSTNTIAYTVEVNGATTSLSATVAGNVTSGQDTLHTVNVNAGDQVTIQVTKAASVSPAVSQVVVTVELV
jgi:hypothetical protein